MRKLKIYELNRLSVEEFKKSEKTPIVVVLDNIRSLNNIGSIFRTSDALSISHIYLCGITATPPHNDIHKTALGAEESVTWTFKERTEDALIELKNQGFIITSIEQAKGSILLHDFRVDKNKKYALVLGNEVKGVQQSVIDKSDLCLEIPQYGTKHSFNVSVTAGIILWELFKQFKF